ncbi:MAG: metallophosphoesterase [bacterium]|nr:metallophosphoesterase [bacterium]
MSKTILSSIRDFCFATALAVCLFASPGYSAQFGFAVITDPHIDGTASHQDKLQTAVNWIIANKNTDHIELVFVLGDIAWGGTNMATAKGILDQLNTAGVPYVPLIGDNERNVDAEFNTTFSPQYTYISDFSGVTNWSKASIPVDGKYLQNFSFDYKGVHFVCPDFNPRTAGKEYAELHDFTGGSWPWFTNDITNCAKPKYENIIMMTHIPIYRTGFAAADRYLITAADMDKVRKFTRSYKDHIAGNYSGHIHCNFSQAVGETASWFSPAIYMGYTTDETWDRQISAESSEKGCTVRWVSVNNDPNRPTYTEHVVDVD